MNPLDSKKTTHWAIASLASAGAIISVNFFELLDRDSGRAHTIVLTAGGAINFGIGGNSASDVSYSMFETKRPANFQDFDLAGARTHSAGAALIVGVGLWSLTIFDRDYGGNLASVQSLEIGGIGVQAQASLFTHGVLKIIYGQGKRSSNNVPLLLPNSDQFPQAQRTPVWTNIPKVR